MINLKPEYAAKAIRKFLSDAEGPNHRYRSWDHCHIAFMNARKQESEGKEIDKDLLSLHLSCYLSSWGMLRNSFLLDRNYRTHLGIVNILLDDADYELLWGFPSNQDDEALNTENLKKYWTVIKTARDTFTAAYAVDSITDTLVTKILLGTCGCIPATDRLYKKGLGAFGGTQYFGLNAYAKIVRYYWSSWDEICGHLMGVPLVSKEDSSTPYPPMKLMDMCFWQIGSCIELHDIGRVGNQKFYKLPEDEKYAVLDGLLE